MSKLIDVFYRQVSSFDTNKVKVVRDNQTIQQVLNSITDASETNKYLVLVPPGHENETFNNKRCVQIHFLSELPSYNLLPYTTVGFSLMPRNTAPHEGSHDVRVKDGYAFSCLYANDIFEVTDIHDPLNPQVVAELSDPILDGIHDIVIQGNYAYVVCSTADSFVCIDISNPKNPQIVGYIQDSTYLDICHALTIEGNYVYLGDFNYHQTFSVIDVSDPSNPHFVGHASFDIVGEKIRGVAKKGNYVFGCGYGAGNLLVFDVSNPTNPTFVTSLSVGTHLNLIRIKDNYVFVTNNYGVDSPEKGEVYVIDISDPQAPVIKNSINIQHAYYIELWKNYAFVTSPRNQAVFVVDITDINNMKIVGVYANHEEFGFDFPAGMTVWNNYLLVACRDARSKTIPLLKIHEGHQRTVQIHYSNVSAQDTSFIHDSIAGTGSTQIITTDFNAPDIPRNVSITMTNNGGSSAGDCWVYGYDVDGNYVRENVGCEPGTTRYSRTIFTEVTQVKFFSNVSSSDSISVGVGNRIGIPEYPISGIDSMIYIRKNGNNITHQFSLDDINIGMKSIDFSGVGITTGDSIEIMYRAFVN